MGTLRVWDDDHVVFADIASPRTVGNVAANPYVEINIVNPFSRRGFRFKGRAEVLRDGEEFITIARELCEHDSPAFPVNSVVRVEAARPVLSPAFTCDPSAKEADIRRRWLAFCGHSGSCMQIPRCGFNPRWELRGREYSCGSSPFGRRMGRR